MNTVGRQERYKKAFIVVLVAVLLSSCIFIGTVLAWLQQDIMRDTDGILNFGEVDFEIYASGTKITSTKDNANGVTTSSSQELAIPAGSTIRSIDLKIRNTGNIDAIMRVTLSIYYKEYYDTDKYNKVALVIQDGVPTINNGIDIQNDGWVDDFKDGVTAGYTYYNDVISPYTISRLPVNGDGSADVTSSDVTSADVTAHAIPVVSQILIPEAMKNETYFITLTVEGVAYKGNIYQELKDKNEHNSYDIPADAYNSSKDIYAYPFGLPSSLPAGWTAWQ